MYKAYVYLEVRVLLSAVPGVFIENFKDSGKKDILTATSTFLDRNNSKSDADDVRIQPSVLHKAAAFVNATGGKMLSVSELERLTGNIQEPPDDKNFTGYSVKVADTGSIKISFHQKTKEIQLQEIRIEEDRGRITRSGGKTRMDWTYAGCPVMRIKTNAAIELGEEAEIFLNELYTLLSYLNLTILDNGENFIRCNAYVSLASYPDEPAYFVKIRNLNSFNFVRKAINSELTRQEEIFSSGGKLVSESRLWIEEQNSTLTFQRRDENLVRFRSIATKGDIEISRFAGECGVEVELPGERRNRFQKEFGLTKLNAEFICSRKDYADFFEEAVNEGIRPTLAFHWFEAEVLRLLDSMHKSIKSCNLTPKKFAAVIKLLEKDEINSSIARELLKEIFTSDQDVDELVRKNARTIISDEKDLLPYVKKVIAENSESIKLLEKGELAPLDYLTGCVMKATEGCAVPKTVKELIKKQLNISVVYIFTMGGAITAEKQKDGRIRAGEALAIKKLLGKSGSDFPLQIAPVRSMLSEETEPADWANLVYEIASKIESGTANGIVVTHGTDTLAYTAALLFWLFNSAKVPVVITASSSLPSESSEARENLALAVKTAREKQNGVYVAYGKKILSALNLKFLANTENGFENWNLKTPVFSTDHYLSRQFLSVPAIDKDVLVSLFNEAAMHFAVVRLYPGLPAKRMEQLVSYDSGIHTVIAELYASGTGNMRNSDFSLKPLLKEGQKNNCRFYCTSQQKCFVDFSQYSTSARVWREGVVPMGLLTTESVAGLYFAASLIADDENELNEIMEAAAEMFILF